MEAAISLNISLLGGRKLFLRNSPLKSLLGFIGQYRDAPNVNHQIMMLVP